MIRPRKPKLERKKPNLEDYGISIQEYDDLRHRYDTNEARRARRHRYISKLSNSLRIALHVLFILALIAIGLLIAVTSFRSANGSEGIINAVAIPIALYFALYGGIKISGAILVFLGEILRPILLRGRRKRRELTPFERYQNDLEAWKYEKRRFRRKTIEYKTKLEQYNNYLNAQKQRDYWRDLDAYEFESEIAHLLRRKGFKATVTKGSGDGGVDIEALKSSELWAVQCKRYKSSVGPAPVRELYGVVQAGKYNRGCVVTTGIFTKGANDFAKDTGISLIDLDDIIAISNGDKTIC